MIETTIKTIEEKIGKTTSIRDENIKELLDLLELLKVEVAELSKTDDEHAKSIAGFTSLSAHEATKEVKNQKLLKLSIEGLSSSVEGAEVSHPKLAEVVNKIAYVLSNMGI